MTVVLVRHGESAGNAGGTVQGWLDAALTPAGHAQAEAVAQRLAPMPVTAIYASTLRRALDTAAAIARPHGLMVTPREALREYGYGEAQGLAWAEIDRRWAPDPERWGDGLIPGEEGRMVFGARVRGEFDAIAERHRDELAVVVSHGGAIAQVVQHALGQRVERNARIAMGNTAITIIETEQDAHVITALNDRCHLSV